MGIGANGTSTGTALLLTERDAFLYDLGHIFPPGNTKGGSLRGIVEQNTQIASGVIDNWKALIAQTNNRRRADYLNATPDELADLLNPSSTTKATNLAAISQFGCANCPAYIFYNNSSAIRAGIWSDAITMYTRLGKKPANNDWDTFFAQYEAHHILPKGLLVPSTLIGVEDALLKYMKHYTGTMFAFNGVANGIMLKKHSSALQIVDGVHASHDDYNRAIAKFLDDKYKVHKATLNSSYSGNILEKEIADLLHTDIKDLLTELKTMLKDKCITGKIKVNDLITDPGFKTLLNIP